jgi:alpha-L-arabinofuranosidase
LPRLDAVALCSNDAQLLSILITNRHPDESIETVVDLTQTGDCGTAQTTLLDGPSFCAQNHWRSPDLVKPITETIEAKQGMYHLTLPPHSLLLLVTALDRDKISSPL